MLPPQVREHAFDPAAGGVIIIDVAIDARIKTHGAVALQGGVELAAAFAKVIVSGIAERQHRIFHAAEIQAVTVNDRVPERRGVVGRFAVAVGARHDQHAVRLLEHVRLTVRHVSDPRGETGWAAARRPVF